MQNQQKLTKKLPKKSPKSYMIYHENPEVFHKGILPPHSYFIPFDKAQNPFESREKSSRFESLKYIDKVLSFLESKNYLSDERYAAAWLNDRRINHYEGQTKLLLELQSRGIDKSEKSVLA